MHGRKKQTRPPTEAEREKERTKVANYRLLCSKLAKCRTATPPVRLWPLTGAPRARPRGERMPEPSERLKTCFPRLDGGLRLEVQTWIFLRVLILRRGGFTARSWLSLWGGLARGRAPFLVRGVPSLGEVADLLELGGLDADLGFLRLPLGRGSGLDLPWARLAGWPCAEEPCRSCRGPSGRPDSPPRGGVRGIPTGPSPHAAQRAVSPSSAIQEHPGIIVNEFRGPAGPSDKADAQAEWLRSGRERRRRGRGNASKARGIQPFQLRPNRSIKRTGKGSRGN